MDLFNKQTPPQIGPGKEFDSWVLGHALGLLPHPPKMRFHKEVVPKLKFLNNSNLVSGAGSDMFGVLTFR